MRKMRRVATVADEIFGDGEKALALADIEFITASNPALMDELCSLDLPCGFNIQAIHTMLDMNMDGEVSKDDFINGMFRLVMNNEFQDKCCDMLAQAVIRKALKEGLQDVKHELRLELKHDILIPIRENAHMLREPTGSRSNAIAVQEREVSQEVSEVKVIVDSSTEMARELSELTVKCDQLIKECSDQLIKEYSDQLMKEKQVIKECIDQNELYPEKETTGWSSKSTSQESAVSMMQVILQKLDKAIESNSEVLRNESSKLRAWVQESLKPTAQESIPLTEDACPTPQFGVDARALAPQLAGEVSGLLSRHFDFVNQTSMQPCAIAKLPLHAQQRVPFSNVQTLPSNVHAELPFNGMARLPFNGMAAGHRIPFEPFEQTQGHPLQRSKKLSRTITAEY